MAFQPDLETMPREQRRTLQDERLRALVRRLASLDVDHWRDKLADVEVGELGGVDDLHALPFTRKHEFRDTYPFGMLAVSRERVVRVHASSGTSGKPTVVAYTAHDVDVFAEVNARSLACAGATAADVIHVAYGYGLFTGGLGLHYGVERLGAAAVPASGGNVPFQLQMLEELGAAGLCSTPSFALLLAERAAGSGVLERLRVRYGVLGAEPWSSAYREKLEAAWGAAGVTFDACDIYGLSEIIGPGVAMECVEGKRAGDPPGGALHVFDDHFLPEVVDPETGAPLPEGERGELVLTTLTKEALPVLRYRTGDATRLVGGDCPCGRTHPRVGRFEGRVDDMLVIRGINVFPREIEAAVLEDPALGGNYAIVVDRRDRLAELEIHAELASNEELHRVDDVAHALEDRLSSRLRLRTAVHVGAPGAIPRQETGKAQRVFERTAADDPFPVSTTGA